jgi:exopolysaccharide production protein ExoQ
LAGVEKVPVAETITLLIFILSSIQIGGPIVVVLQLGLLGLLLLHTALFRPHVFLGSFKFWPLMLLPIFAVSSAAWSVAPEVSSKYGIQLCITAIIGITLARVVSPRSYVALLYAACAGVCIGSLLSGRMGASVEGPVLIGLTGSKNEMAYSAQLLMTSSIAVLIDRGQSTALRVSTIFFICIATAILALGQAAGALLTAFGGVGILTILAVVHAMRLWARIVVIAALLIMIPPIVLSRDVIIEGVQSFTQDVLKKDTTLTGRTYLWARADELIRERPLIGHGYRAILVGGSVEGQGILRWAGQQDGRVFHFHSTYKDVAVDFGYVGLTIFVATMGLALLSLTKLVLFHPTPAYSFFLASFLTILSKSPAELVIGQFYITFAMLFTLWVWAFTKPPENAKWLGRAHAPVIKRNLDLERAIDATPIRAARPIREMRSTTRTDG